MDSKYMLNNSVSEKLYETSKRLPIIDYHCHLSPKEIFEDKPFDNIGEIWLGADHYKWRLMRTAGIDEEYITGDKTYKEKFIKYCSALEFAAGNPLYYWSHMELSMFFGIDDNITSQNAEDIWNKANKYIANTEMSPRKLIERSNVEVVCTTDDIIDDLSWHKKIADDKTCCHLSDPEGFITKYVPANNVGTPVLGCPKPGLRTHHPDGHPGRGVPTLAQWLPSKPAETDESASPRPWRRNLEFIICNL